MKRILLFLALASCALAGTWVASPGKGAHGSATIPLTTSLVSYFKMDEASGSITDIHGGKTFTESGGTIGTASGIISTARTSAGTNIFATRADDTSFEPGSNPFFITLWAKPDSLSQTTNPSFIAKWASVGPNIEWTVHFNDSDNGAILVVYSGGYTQVAAASVFPDTSTWKFIAAGWDGTNIKISINGGAFTTTAFTGPVDAGTSTVNIFTRDNNSGVSAFQGAIDEMAFWKGRCLTLAEVQTIYASGAGKAYSTW